MSDSQTYAQAFVRTFDVQSFRSHFLIVRFLRCSGQQFRIRDTYGTMAFDARFNHHSIEQSPISGGSVCVQKYYCSRYDGTARVCVPHSALLACACVEVCSFVVWVGAYRVPPVFQTFVSVFGWSAGDTLSSQLWNALR